MAPILVEDILVRILCSCDIATVLAASLASRSLYALSTSKHVWLALLSDLQSRGFVDLLPDQQLDQLSRQELVDLVKRIVHGPETWYTSDPSPPTIARQIILKPNIRQGPGILDWENEPQLLPGGRFVLFLQSGDIECRDTLEDKLVWAYQPRSQSHYVKGYAADVVDEGRTAMILLGIRTYERHKDRKNFLEVVRLDLNAGSSTSQVFTAAPNTPHDNPFGRLSIQGDFAAASILHEVVVIQLSTASCSVFAATLDPVDIAIVPQHIIILKAGRKPSLKIWKTWDLLERDTERGAEYGTVEPQPVVTVTFPDHDDLSASVYLGSHLSPLRHDSSTIWAVISASSSTSDSRSVYSYRVSYDHPGPLSITPARLPVQTEQPRIHQDVYNISFSGFMNFADRVLSPEGGMKAAELPDRGQFVHMSAYSGALTYATWESIFINYYK